MFRAELPGTNFQTKAYYYVGRQLGDILSWNPIDYIARRNIHPASTRFLESRAPKPLVGKVIQYQTPDGKTLEALHIQKSWSKNKNVIVIAQGNDGCFQHTDYQKSFSLFNDSDIIIPNYRGVENSTGRSSPLGIALDIYSTCEYAHKEMGIDPSRVTVYGHSLGGYAGVKGGALFQAKHPNAKVSIINDRSFSSLTYTVYKLGNIFVAAFVWIMGWEMDATKDWDTFKGKKVVIYTKQDFLYPVSFYDAVSKKKGTQTIELQTAGKTPAEAHNRYLYRFEALDLRFKLL